MKPPYFDESGSHVRAPIAYTMPIDGPARVRVFPPSSGLKTESPSREKHDMPIFDCRPFLSELGIDVSGFSIATCPTSFSTYFDEEQVRKQYYPEVAEVLKAALGATAVFVFDHNVRSAPRSAAGEPGVREPVEGAHNDYTLASGPLRIAQVLEENGASDLLGNRAALINLWRPIVGPVQDHPLAICDYRSTALPDFIPTEIQHFGEADLEQPQHTGEISSFQHSERHRWLYVSDMTPDEVIFLKCFDTADDGRARWTGHTGFRNPASPADAVPRESIEARTVVVFPQAR